MSGRALNILLTGPPGCGKTTLIRRVVAGMSTPVRGFYTEEVRGPDGLRSGFDIVLMDGRSGPLARVQSKGPQVGKYGVCLEYLETVALNRVNEPMGGIVVIDEIGKMECLSGAFTEVVRSLLDGNTSVMGTVALGGAAFIREVRSRPDVELIEVTAENRDVLVEEIREKVERIRKKV
jgi:nucleoside-triphosphatase